MSDEEIIKNHKRIGCEYHNGEYGYDCLSCVKANEQELMKKAREEGEKEGANENLIKAVINISRGVCMSCGGVIDFSEYKIPMCSACRLSIWSRVINEKLYWNNSKEIEKLFGSDKRGLNRSAGGKSVQEKASERGLKSPAPAKKKVCKHEYPPSPQIYGSFGGVTSCVKCGEIL